MGRFLILLVEKINRGNFEVTLKEQKEFDKLLTGFSKFVLGGHAKASYFETVSELSQGPLTIWLNEVV